MAKAISDEELQLKKRARRRLVGAIALVLLIVVFLPMMLDSEPRPLNQDISINIPPIPKAAESPGQGAAPVQVVPPLTASKPHVAGLPEGGFARPEVSPATDPKAELPRNEAPQLETKPAGRTAQKHDARSVASSQGAGDDGFVVQLGVFSNAANARKLQKKLQDNKFKAYTEIMKSTGGDRTRVRVGPYPTREAAEKARDRLKSMKLIIGDAAVVRRD